VSRIGAAGAVFDSGSEPARASRGFGYLAGTGRQTESHAGGAKASCCATPA
jgi:hypothetical protein